MATAGATRQVIEHPEGDGLFERVGLFLQEHRLSPEPEHYSFAYHVLSHPDGVLAQAVRAIADGGVRLSRHDIAALGGEAVAGAPVAIADHPRARFTAGDDATPDPEREAGAPPDTDTLLAQTQFQVDGFADTVRAIHCETSHFGRDIAASAAAMQTMSLSDGIDEIARLTGAMIERVRTAEVRLEAATREANHLRAALDEARGSARQDPLTELPNRRAFDEAYAVLPPDTGITLAVCDIDHFKRVNDEFGHAVGDRVLKAIAQTLAAECEGHLVVRYGGEEFAVLFEGVDVHTASGIVERARTAVAARRFRLRATDALIGEITISAGVAGATAAEMKETVLGRADTALYGAKRTGRNRVAIAPAGGE